MYFTVLFITTGSEQLAHELMDPSDPVTFGILTSKNGGTH
jgi:hypothetical protein